MSGPPILHADPERGRCTVEPLIKVTPDVGTNPLSRYIQIQGVSGQQSCKSIIIIISYEDTLGKG